ncbi:MAG TPA: SRPBCC family protein [Candidatus Limnocylindria bacterium]|nr:SRPBCC family protein [Candidatus Limnocylindria bacterium]
MRASVNNVRHEMIVVIDRPIEEVWAFMADVFNVPRLRGQTLAIRMTSAGPVGVGSTLQARMSIFGFETRIHGVLTEWDAPRAMAFSVTMGAGTGIVRQALEPMGSATKVVRLIELDLKRRFRLVWPILGPLVRRRWDRATRNLKQLVEADGTVGSVAEAQRPGD